MHLEMTEQTKVESGNCESINLIPLILLSDQGVSPGNFIVVREKILTGILSMFLKIQLHTPVAEGSPIKRQCN